MSLLRSLSPNVSVALANSVISPESVHGLVHD